MRDVDSENDFYLKAIWCLIAYMTCKRQVDISIEARCVWSGQTLLTEEIFKMFYTSSQQSQSPYVIPSLLKLPFECVYYKNNLELSLQLKQ